MSRSRRICSNADNASMVCFPSSVAIMVDRLSHVLPAEAYSRGDFETALMARALAGGARRAKQTHLV
jgi:hypothetical protein